VLLVSRAMDKVDGKRKKREVVRLETRGTTFASCLKVRVRGLLFDRFQVYLPRTLRMSEKYSLFQLGKSFAKNRQRVSRGSSAALEKRCTRFNIVPSTKNNPSLNYPRVQQGSRQLDPVAETRPLARPLSVLLCFWPPTCPVPKER